MQGEPTLLWGKFGKSVRIHGGCEMVKNPMRGPAHSEGQCAGRGKPEMLLQRQGREPISTWIHKLLFLFRGAWL